MTTPAAARSGPRGIRPGLIAALGYIAMAGSLSTDLYLPAFPDIVDDFGVSASVVQLTLTAFLLGSAFGQLLIGSISDALGRRRTLLVALTAFAICGYLAALSPTLEVLISVRGVQGFTGAAGAVLARAIVADLVDRDQAVRAFSALWMATALGPMIASPLGALLTNLGGWRAALLGLAVIATGMLICSAIMIPESLPRERRHPFTVTALAGNVGRLLRDVGYLGYAIAFAAGYAALITYISSSSFIVQGVYGIGPLGYALTFTFSSLAVMTGAWLYGRLAHRVGADSMLRWAQAMVLVAAATAAALALTGAFTFPWYLALVGVFATGCGGVISGASTIAVGHAQRTAGAGSALLGFLQFTLGAFASPLGGLMGSGTALPATLAMTAFAVLGVVSASVGRRRLARTSV